MAFMVVILTAGIGSFMYAAERSRVSRVIRARVLADGRPLACLVVMRRRSCSSGWSLVRDSGVSPAYLSTTLGSVPGRASYGCSSSSR